MNDKTARIFMNKKEIEYLFQLIDKAMDNSKSKEEFEICRDIRVKILNGKEAFNNER